MQRKYVQDLYEARNKSLWKEIKEELNREIYSPFL